MSNDADDDSKTREIKGYCHCSVHLSVPSILPPGFKSQAHRPCFFQFIVELCHLEKTIFKKLAESK